MYLGWRQMSEPGANFRRPTGKGIPVITMPCVNAAYVQHTQFHQSAMGVHVLYGDGGFVPNEPGQGRPDAYPWHLTLAAAESVIS